MKRAVTERERERESEREGSISLVTQPEMYNITRF
jgi:hypothetical protein